MRNEIITGDCFEELDRLDEDSVHAVVTDPPYGLNFMPSTTNGWDDFEPTEYQAWCEKWATECLRVLKPGGHLLAFSGNRTHHRLMSGIEDAGYEIRDTITWHYGSGFPKALDVSKAIDKRGGRSVKGVGPLIKEARESKGLTTRDVAEYFADEGQEPTGCVWNWENGDSNPTVENLNRLIEVLDLPIEPIEPGDREVIRKGSSGETAIMQGIGDETSAGGEFEVTKPATEQAEQWDGFKSALKPATEFVCVARSPLAEDTIAENVVTHGTGALNIDACRIGTDGEKINRNIYDGEDYNGSNYGQVSQKVTKKYTDTGRYPSNVVFDAQQADVLDDEVGETEPRKDPGHRESGFLVMLINKRMANGWKAIQAVPLGISIPQKHRRQSEHLTGRLTMHIQQSNRLT